MLKIRVRTSNSSSTTKTEKEPSVEDQEGEKTEDQTEKEESGSSSPKTRRCQSSDRGCSLPADDPGTLLDMTDVTAYLSVHRHSEQSQPEVCSACVDALIVYAAELHKKSKWWCLCFDWSVRDSLCVNEVF